MRTAYIQNGIVHDGSGSQPFQADVVVSDGVIIDVVKGGVGDKGPDGQVIDAAGLAVAPGFIDCHSHADWILPEPDHQEILAPLLLQGVTAAIGGNCGFSPFPVSSSTIDTVLEYSRFLTNNAFSFRWESGQEYFNSLRKNGTCLHFSSLAGHGPMRTLIKGVSPQPMSDQELISLASVIEQAIDHGACGVSLGLAYVPGIFADDREIETVFRTAARSGKPVTVHGRTYSQISPFYPKIPCGKAHILLDLAASIDMARKTGASLHISHLLLKGVHTWELWPEVLEQFDQADKDGIDVTFGVIPYHWGNTLINTLFPKWFLENFAGNVNDPSLVRRLGEEVYATEQAIGRNFGDLYLLWGVNPELQPLEGLSFLDIADRLGMDGIGACLYLAKKSGGRAKILTAAYSGREQEYSEPLEQLLSHPLALVEIDTILTSPAGPQNPASFGALPKWLGFFSRERGLMPMEQAVRRISGAAADRFGMKARGYIRKGYAADLVIFSPESIRDNNTVQEPTLPPEGIHYTIINGRVKVAGGALVRTDPNGSVLTAG